MDRITACIVIMSFFWPMSTRGRPFQVLPRDGFGDAAQSAEGDVECFTEYMDLWVHRSRAEGLRLWLAGALRVPVSLTSPEELSWRLSACGYALHRDADRHYSFRVMYSGCSVRLEHSNYILVLNLMKRPGRFGGRSNRLVMKCPLVTAPPGGVHIHCDPDYVQVTRPLHRDSWNNELRWSLSLRGELVAALEDSSLIQLSAETRGSNITVQGQRKEIMDSVEVMGRAIDVLPLWLVSGYYAYSMEANCPNVSSSPADETVLHISKRRMGLIKRAGYDRESLNLLSVIVKQTDVYSVSENHDFLQLTVPTDHILQRKSCTSSASESLLQLFFRVDVILTFREMPYRVYWSMENVFPCSEFPAVDPSPAGSVGLGSSAATPSDAFPTEPFASWPFPTADRAPADSGQPTGNAGARQPVPGTASLAPRVQAGMGVDPEGTGTNPTAAPAWTSLSVPVPFEGPSSTSVRDGARPLASALSQVTTVGDTVTPAGAEGSLSRLYPAPQPESPSPESSPAPFVSPSLPTSASPAQAAGGGSSAGPLPSATATSTSGQETGLQGMLGKAFTPTASAQVSGGPQEDTRGSGWRAAPPTGGPENDKALSKGPPPPRGIPGTAAEEREGVHVGKLPEARGVGLIDHPELASSASFLGAEDETGEDSSRVTAHTALASSAAYSDALQGAPDAPTTAVEPSLLRQPAAEKAPVGRTPPGPPSDHTAADASADSKQMQASGPLPGAPRGQISSNLPAPTSAENMSEFNMSAHRTASHSMTLDELRLFPDSPAVLLENHTRSALDGSLLPQSVTAGVSQEGRLGLASNASLESWD
ncbi:uncharacterized protein C1orf127 homolog [Lepisosteus oculatus]|uniref:uncharacterized protein C1orf127 homolog n=1 Tax=Lepisosteus oculatus TaxID=7918 RepID=UPI00371436B3